MPPITFPEFKGRCEFSIKGDTITGTVHVQDADGIIKKIIARRSISPVAQELAAQSPIGWGIPGVDVDDAWGAVKDTAKAVVKNDVAKQLYKASKVAVKTSFKVAADPRVQAGINLAVPGAGNALKIGTQAANLIGAATAGKSPAAKAQIANIVNRAKAGDPTAKKAEAVLKNVYQAGAKKGAWGATAKRGSSPGKTPAKPGKYGVAIAAGLGGLALLALL